MMKNMTETEKHIKALELFVEFGMIDEATAEKEIANTIIGLTPATFSIWVKRPAAMQHKGVWFELYRNEPADEIFKIWMEDSAKDWQLRIYSKAQSDLCSKSNLAFA